VSDLATRRVLITGASSGLGRRFALALAARGASVALAARRTEGLAEVAREIEGAGGRACPIAMDVEDEKSIIGGFDVACAELGGLIDTVIANAGTNRRGMALDLSADDFDRVIGVNLRGVFLTAREGARRMIAAGSSDSARGRIVLVSSIGAFKPLPGVAAYCASKAAVASLGKSLARECCNRGINVNVICPGYVETELNGDFLREPSGLKLIASFPRRRLMAPEDLDEIVAYLASGASRAVTGSIFTLDDGQTL